VIAALIAGAMNSIAGGGTLLTFPALIALGVAPLSANATSTVALWPGTVGSLWGYRDELRGARPWAIGFALPSLVGGAVGAWLLILTPPDRFAALVPWLVLGATALFVLQRPPVPNAEPMGVSDAKLTSRHPATWIVIGQFLIAIYGGYFGAGVGILMLAAMGFVGLRNIHRMNGLKNWGGLCMNVVAALIFAFSDLVTWPIAFAMAVGSVVGGYLGSRTAQRVPQALVRGAVVVIGVVSGILLYVSR
jgi:uncharacterized membrane protein YfcA